MPSLTYIIVTFNSAETIAACLRSIVASSFAGLRHSIVLVDNASKDETVPVARGEGIPELEIVQAEENTGFARAANLGASHADGEYLCFLNPDAAVESDFAAEFASAAGGAVPFEIGGAALTAPSGRPAPSAWCLPSFPSLVAETFLPYTIAGFLTSRRPACAKEVGMVSGACLIVRKNVFDRLNGFNENFFLYYEDADFCRRAAAEGFRVRFHPRLRAIHAGRKSFGADAGGFFFQYYRSRILYCRLQCSRFASRIAERSVMAGVFLRIALYGLSARLSGSEEFRRLGIAHREAMERLQRSRSAV